MKCDCYHADKNYLGRIGVCWGTKEMEPCSCGGDKSKCDFYPELRERSLTIMDKSCPLLKNCDCKTAACRASLPDESCYWYRWFKQRINEVEDHLSLDEIEKTEKDKLVEQTMENFGNFLLNFWKLRDLENG